MAECYSNPRCVTPEPKLDTGMSLDSQRFNSRNLRLSPSHKTIDAKLWSTQQVWDPIEPNLSVVQARCHIHHRRHVNIPSQYSSVRCATAQQKSVVKQMAPAIVLSHLYKVKIKKNVERQKFASCKRPAVISRKRWLRAFGLLSQSLASVQLLLIR